MPAAQKTVVRGLGRQVADDSGVAVRHRANGSGRRFVEHGMPVLDGAPGSA